MATPSNKRSRDSESTEEPVVDEKSTSKQNNAAPEENKLLVWKSSKN